MRGINKRVIEIQEPEDEYIDRVLVFLKPGKPEVRVRNAREQAEGYVQNLVCERRRPRVGLIAASLAAAAAVIAALIALF